MSDIIWCAYAGKYLAATGMTDIECLINFNNKISETVRNGLVQSLADDIVRYGITIEKVKIIREGK
jgi:hypothetical protein